MNVGSGIRRLVPHVRVPRLPELRFRQWRVIRDRSRDRRLRSTSRLFNRRLLIHVVLWVVGILAFGAGLLQTHLFTIERIDVTGTTHLSRDDVLRIAKLKTGVSIAEVNASASERRLEAEPWILRAHVQTDWPHAVRVVVTEQRAVALAQSSDKKWVQIGPDGTILAVSDTPTPDVPALLNVQAPTQVGAFVDAAYGPLVNVATLLPVALQPRVQQLDVNNGNFRLGLDAGTVVNLGNGDDMADKLLSVASVISHTDPKTLAELDVSSPRFPVARPVGQTLVPKATTATTTTIVSKTKKTTGTTTIVPRRTTSR